MTKQILKQTALAIGVSAILGSPAHAGLIDLSGIDVGGESPSVFTYTETDTGPLESITFDLSVEHFGISWGSETGIQLIDPSGSDIFLFFGDTDFGWTDDAGIFNFAGNVLASGPTDIAGDWTVALSDTFDDSVDIDHTYLEVSTITLNAGRQVDPPPSGVPAPATLLVMGAGLGLLGWRKRRRS